MRVGVPKEIKVHEYRVGLTPGSVRELVSQGNQVFVEAGAGLGIGLADGDYLQAGAAIVSSATKIFEQADLVVKVRNPRRPSVPSYGPGRFFLPTSTWPATGNKPRTL